MEVDSKFVTEKKKPFFFFENGDKSCTTVPVEITVSSWTDTLKGEGLSYYITGRNKSVLFHPMLPWWVEDVSWSER